MKSRKNKSHIKQNHTKQNHKTNKIRRNLHGGEVIASGGYGCIFRPALKCKGDSKRGTHQITKLMKKKHAEYEYKEITQFLPILRKIPNYQNYFIVDNVSLCEPDNLNEDDLEHFSSKCKALKKIDLNVENINNNLDKLLALNIPDGGMDVGDYIEADKPIPELNQMLIDLLKHGIVPMNSFHVYHGDVKESNILTGKDSDSHAKLIDWGLSAKTDGNIIPKIFYRKPLQYNIPFSCILFNDTFTEMFTEFVKDKPIKKSDKQIKSFVRKFLYEWNDERGEGHLNLILKMMKLSLGNKSKGIGIIIDYLSEIIQTFGIDNHSEDWLMSYFKTVYLKNLDIWGWIMSYSPILEKTKTNTKTKNNYPKLKQIFATYLYDPAKATKVINVEQVVQDMEEVFDEYTDEHLHP